MTPVERHVLAIAAGRRSAKLSEIAAAAGVGTPTVARALRLGGWQEFQHHKGAPTWFPPEVPAVPAYGAGQRPSTPTPEQSAAPSDAHGVLPDDGPLPTRMLVDSDNHFPIQDQAVQDAKLAFASDWKPDLWVNAGDQYDVYSLSNYPKDPTRASKGHFTLQDELDSSRDYWREVCSVASRVAFIPGNHEARLSKHIAANPGLYDLAALDWSRMADLPAKVRVLRYGDVLRVGNINIEHGDKIGGRFGCQYPSQVYLRGNRASQNVIFGHHHRSERADKTIWTDEGPKPITAIAQGHGSDVAAAEYIQQPPWIHGFTAVEFYQVDGRARFTAFPIIVVRGRFSFGGKVYSG